MAMPAATIAVAPIPDHGLGEAINDRLKTAIPELFAGLPDRGTSVLVVSHDLPLLRRMRRRVLVLDHGRLVDDISPQDLAE